MATPSGRRSSEPVAAADRQRQGAEHRGHGGHHNGPKTQQRRFMNGFHCRLLPSVRSTCSAKSIIKIAFFFTMPISRMMPISAMMLRVHPEELQRQQRADASGRQRRENRNRVNVALVQNSEHDVHRRERRQNQNGSDESES